MVLRTISPNERALVLNSLSNGLCGKPLELHEQRGVQQAACGIFRGNGKSRAMSTCEGSPRAGAVVSVSARSIWLWAALLAVLASLPSLVVGFSSDDLSHRLALEGRAPGYAGGWFGLYDFTLPSMPAAALIKQGLFPWFTDPAVSLRFFRPLSSATLALDNALFGRNPLFAHVHSLLWMAVLAGATGRL